MIDRKFETIRASNILEDFYLVERWAIDNHELNRGDIKQIIYLEPKNYFTINEWKTGELRCSWDPKRLYRLIKDGWFKKTHHGGGRVGGHSKYTATRQCKLLVTRMYRMLYGLEPIPESEKSNKIMKRERYVDSRYSQAIKQFNKNKQDG